MKRHLLLSTVTLLLSGCFQFFYKFYVHDVSITLKDGVPCFGLADDEQVRSKQVRIYSLAVTHHKSTIPQKDVMVKFMNNAILQSGECVPYEGETLENNLIYPISFDVSIENQNHNEEHGYGGSFCLSEDKNGEKVLHHFKIGERPASCPVSNDE